MRCLLPLLVAAALASCGADDEPTTAESPPPTTTETVTTTESQPTTGTTTESQPGGCGTQGPYTVNVVNGEVPCALARSTVAGFDPSGAKVQEIGAYTCQGGTGATRPVVFTCVAGDNEITASEP